MIHHVANVTSTKAKLFTIRYGINQTINLPEISKIVIITDSIHTVKKIFDLAIYLFQIHSAAISKELRKFSLPIVTTQSSFGNALANVIGLYSNL